MSRTDPSVFQLPVKKMREGWYSDQYFNHTKRLLETTGHNPNVVMQCFQRKDSLLGGVDEAIAILKLCSGYNDPNLPDKVVMGRELVKRDKWVNGWDQLTVKALNEGDEISPWEPVLQIEGPYHLFAHLETVILGVMARRSLVMRNVREVVNAANGKPIWFFPARHDHWVVQTGDGLAAHQAGASSVSTDAGASWWGGKGMGTIPHALIAAYGGNTVAAARAFADLYADEMAVTVLVDFDNTSIDTALQVLRELGPRLSGVRLDTSGNLTDDSVAGGLGIKDRDDFGRFNPLGVNPQLVENTRYALDLNGGEHVKIVVSGGFKAEKIRAFEAAGIPVDAYGVGSSLIRGDNDFTADVVMAELAGVEKYADRSRRYISNNGWIDVAKVGRDMMDDSRLQVVE
jgi:nicotinate phosphoribosyltransferase